MISFEDSTKLRKTQHQNAMASTKCRHRPFSMLPDSLRGDSNAEFATTVYDVIRGIKLCVELVHVSDLERQHNEFADTPEDLGVPTISVAHADTLTRFVIATSEMLATVAEHHIGWIEMRAQQGGTQ